MKLLLIEDEKILLNNLKAYLSKEFMCDTAISFTEAVQKIEMNNYDCLLLDLSLGEKDGTEILELLKSEKRKEGIIIISARSELNDRVNGLERGADDYLAKPFHLTELVARIKSVMRRKQFDGEKIIQLNELEIHTDNQLIFVNKKPLSLSNKETRLFIFLINNKNRLVSKAAIANHISNFGIDYSNYDDIVYAHIKNLKRKLKAAGCKDYIKTIHGLGYKFELH